MLPYDPCDHFTCPNVGTGEGEADDYIGEIVQGAAQMSSHGDQPQLMMRGCGELVDDEDDVVECTLC